MSEVFACVVLCVRRTAITALDVGVRYRSFSFAASTMLRFVAHFGALRQHGLVGGVIFVRRRSVPASLIAVS